MQLFTVLFLCADQRPVEKDQRQLTSGNITKDKQGDAETTLNSSFVMVGLELKGGIANINATRTKQVLV